MISPMVYIPEEVRNEAFGLTLDGHQNQNDLILELIRRLNRGNGSMKYPSARDINSYFPNMLLTSIRRSLTNLRKAGEIEATGKRIYRINGESVPSTTYKILVIQKGLF